MGGGGGFCELTRYERSGDIPFETGYRYSTDLHVRTNPLLTIYCESGSAGLAGIGVSLLIYPVGGGRFT